MKNMFSIIFVSFLASQMLSALDLHTDNACEPLKKALQQAQPLEKVQAAWNMLLSNSLTSQYATIELATQVIAYAQEQKGNLESQVTQLGTKSYDRSKLMWGSIKTGAGLWCAIGTIFYGLTHQGIYITHNGAIQDILGVLFLPDMKFIISLPKSVKNVIRFIKKQPRINYVFPLLGLLRCAGAAWSLYAGISDIRQGLTHKSTLENNIKNLTAAIEFISPWTDPVLGNQFEGRNWGTESIPA